MIKYETIDYKDSTKFMLEEIRRTHEKTIKAFKKLKNGKEDPFHFLNLFGEHYKAWNIWKKSLKSIRKGYLKP